jgi:hypothetical protein
VNLVMHLEAVIKQVWGDISRPRSSISEGQLESEIKLNSEMHLEAVIE